MPFLIAILTAIGGALWWWFRSNPREAIDTAGDLITTAANAPRRHAFRRQHNAHPVEGIDDPRIAICAIGQAFLELDDLPTKEQRDQLHIAVRKQLRTQEEEAEEMEVLGRWLIGQCNGASQAIPRLGKRLNRIDPGSWNALQEFLAPLAGPDLSSAQIDAVAELKRKFGMR